MIVPADLQGEPSMMQMSARVTNTFGSHKVILRTNDNEQSLIIAPKSSGYGSSVNGGELLLLALATCYCNDLYREAAQRNITVRSVQVEVNGEFSGEPGGPARNITYRARVEAEASEDEIRDLLQHTDTVAEIQNTLRQATNVSLAEVEAVEV
jgi:uncharacterized OsmC-like protein